MDTDKIILTILFVFFAVGIFLYGTLLSYLKREHTETWMALGSPTIFANSSMSNNISMLKFLWKKEYLKVEDTKLRSIARVTHYFSMFYLVFFVGLILLLFPWSKFAK